MNHIQTIYTVSYEKASSWYMRPMKAQISLRDWIPWNISTYNKFNLSISAVWSESSLGAFWIAKDVKFLRMHRLIWVFVGRTYEKVCFLTLMLIIIKIVYCRLNRRFLYILEESNFNFRYVRLWDLDIIRREKMAQLFANSGDPDQTPRSVASDLGLHCLRITLLRVSRLQWVNHSLLLHQNLTIPVLQLVDVSTKLAELQTVQTLIRRRRTRRLIWAYTVYSGLAVRIRTMSGVTQEGQRICKHEQTRSVCACAQSHQGLPMFSIFSQFAGFTETSPHASL